MPRIIAVYRCSECPWNSWDYREQLFRCCEPSSRKTQFIPEQNRFSAPPSWCPLVEARILLKIESAPEKVA